MSGVDDGLTGPTHGPEHGADTPAIRVASRGDSRRRGGHRFTRDPIELEPPVLTADLARAVLADDQLVVEIREGGRFVAPTAVNDVSGQLAKMDAAVAAGVTNLPVESEGMVSPGAKLGRDETAPFGGGRTGSGFVDDGGSPAYRQAVTGERQPVPGVTETMARADLADAVRRDLDAADRGEPPVLSASVDPAIGAGVPVGSIDTPPDPPIMPDEPVVDTGGTVPVADPPIMPDEPVVDATPDPAPDPAPVAPTPPPSPAKPRTRKSTAK